MAVSSKDLAKEFPYTEDCELLAKQIDLLVINKEYWSRQSNNSEADATNNYLSAKRKWYNVYGCLSKVNAIKMKDVSGVFNAFGEEDKLRIEKQIASEVKKRNIIGLSVLMVSLLMIIILSEIRKK
jgi:hypothetical protein